MKTIAVLVLVCLAALGGRLAIHGESYSGDSDTPESRKAEASIAPASSLDGFVLHEWGTFTSFSGSNGVAVSFHPNNTDLPQFVYHHSGDAFSKSRRLLRSGLISMETPVIYFYASKEMQASVKVGFPKGWITEWYPHATTAPDQPEGDGKVKLDYKEGESISWRIRLQQDNSARFPHEVNENPYYSARETDSVSLQTTFALPENVNVEPIRGGSIAQTEKFLFYRGVGTFQPPVTVQALGQGHVRVKNASGGKATGLVLVVVRDSRVGFRTLSDLEAGNAASAEIPEATSSSNELAVVIEKSLIGAGLYEREAHAMVKTWDHAWFHEEGMRVLYLLPRSRTDELLPLTVSPPPSETVRVIVGRHDFLTPEQEIMAEQQVQKMNKAEADLAAARSELAKLGRFANEAQQSASVRIDAKSKK